MKRLLFSVFLILFSSVCFAGTLNVCLCPANEEISSYLENKVTAVPYSEELSSLIQKVREEREILALENDLHASYKTEDISSINAAKDSISSYSYKDDGEDFKIVTTSYFSSFTEDRNVLKYICSQTDSEILIFNEIKDLNAVSLRTITVYSLLTDEITELSTVISSDTDVFTAEEYSALGSFFSYSEEYEDVTEPEVVYGPLTVDSNVVSSVYINGKNVGETPYILDSYTLPLLLTLKSEGYIDQYISLNEAKDEVSVILKPQWMDDSQLYKKASDSFYASFGGMLLSIGLKAVVNSAISSESSYYNLADKVSTGLIVVSIGNMVYRLIDYYNYADYNSKR
ncbi:MAG: PEGA domain-containing protein [Sphaerochaetaceae bacterium]|nr:PEGA domain-containing protein [Sphaerochaetaceae bacterium]